MSPPPTPSPSLLDRLIDQVVAVDLRGPFLVLGRLSGYDPGFLNLADADLHDLRESGSTRDFYLFERRESGLRTNRRRLLVNRQEIVALCAFEDFVA